MGIFLRSSLFEPQVAPIIFLDIFFTIISFIGESIAQQ
jgi:hypothetical protein